MTSDIILKGARRVFLGARKLKGAQGEKITRESIVEREKI